MRRFRAITLASCLAFASVLTAACGDGEQSVLETAEERTAEMTSGNLTLEFAAVSGAADAPAAGPVGFRVEGLFAFDGGGELAVVDLTYTQLLGDDSEEVRLVSTGSKAYVTTNGETLEVPDAQVAALRLGDGGGGLSDLGFAGWIDDPVVGEGPAVDGAKTERITGTLDVADMLSDVARVSAQVGGGDDLVPIVGDDATRIQALVTASEAEIVVDADDRLLRSLRAVADFGREVPEKLREVLGSFAAAHLEVTVELRELTGPLRVTAPG